jgi:threonine aldolase
MALIWRVWLRREARTALGSRLGDDHVRARALADGLRRGGLDVLQPETNIVLLSAGPELLRAARERGVLLSTIGRYIRAVTHLGIDDQAISTAVEVIALSAVA